MSLVAVTVAAHHPALSGLTRQSRPTGNCAYRRSAATVNNDPGQDAWALVKLAQGGDADAFGVLYSKYRGDIYRYLVRRLGNKLNAEDLASETFIRALKSIESFTYQGRDFGAWLTTIARNLAFDFLKSKSHRCEVFTSAVVEDGSTDASAEVRALQRATVERVEDYLNHLPHAQRTCLFLRFLVGLPVNDTAVAMGRSAQAVRQLQLRAVKKLARVVSADDCF